VRIQWPEVESQNEGEMVVEARENAVKEKMGCILSRYSPGKQDDLIPVLQETQAEFGFLPADAMSEIAEHLDTTRNTVFGVATFYAQFRFKPSGRQRIMVCRGTACHVRGGPRILEEVERVLGIKDGEMTQDGEYSIETAACFGSCALSPVMVVNDRVYGRVTPAKVWQILGKKD
jgi:NADH-quinone oxidoreductase subunit E